MFVRTINLFWYLNICLSNSQNVVIIMVAEFTQSFNHDICNKAALM